MKDKLKFKEVCLVFPHQLFEDSPLPMEGKSVLLVEEYLFFRQYKFHKQKITFHRASMKFYEDYLQAKGYSTKYIEADKKEANIRILIPLLKEKGVEEIHYIDPTDNWLEKRLKKGIGETGIALYRHESPLFLNSKDDLSEFFKPSKKKFFQTDFYIQQRKKRRILIDEKFKPEGGKWSFDAENRKKYPRKKTPPQITFPSSNPFYEEAKSYVELHFQDHYGEITDTPLYPFTFETSEDWLDQFLVKRFEEFGAYEDAIVAEESILHHSVLTPMLNVGLLTPQKIINKSLSFALKNDIPLNSLEGFIRQIIGWREFIRGIYEVKGTEERTRNYWGFTRKIPKSFWTGETGIEPIDLTIKKVLKTGYCHHIERLMVLGNFMLLCEFDPNEVYRWFMELFIDAYDWVMVPNVYGMSQFADGGLMSTKPYISGSNYLKKMSNYAKGPWQQTWDGLFWRFMHVHRDFFLSNPRLGMLIRTFDKMGDGKRNGHLEAAEGYLKGLS